MPWKSALFGGAASGVAWELARHVYGGIASLFFSANKVYGSLGIAPLFLMWIFTERLEIAFNSFIVGFMGFLVLPFTTFFYALAYAPVGGVEGFGWILVGFGLFLDIGAYTSGGMSRSRQSAV